MKISDELIACYVEGTVTAEERNFVRRYLCEHPETYEHILCLMDNDTVDYLGEQLEISDNCIPMNESSSQKLRIQQRHLPLSKTNYSYLKISHRKPRQANYMIG